LMQGEVGRWRIKGPATCVAELAQSHA
jgi:hypothetical protein